MAENRIVVTGMGAITPLDLNVEQLWEGRSGVGHITLFDAHNFPVRIAAEVKGFDPSDYMDHKLAQRAGRAGQFAIAAEAVRSAQLRVADEPERASRPFNWERDGFVMGRGPSSSWRSRNTL